MVWGCCTVIGVVGVSLTGVGFCEVVDVSAGLSTATGDCGCDVLRTVVTVVLVVLTGVAGIKITTGGSSLRCEMSSSGT